MPPAGPDLNGSLTGTTHSSDCPYTAQSTSGRPGVFLTKLDPTGSKLVWSVQQGGDLPAFDSGGNLILGGSATPAAGLPDEYPPYPIPPPPAAGDVPAACQPTGLRVQIAAFVQRLRAVDGSVLATQLLSATRAQPSALDVLPDGRVLVAGASAFPDCPDHTGHSVQQRHSATHCLRSLSGRLRFGNVIAWRTAGVRRGWLTNMPIGPVAPGQLISLFGNGLGPAQPVSASISGPDPVPLSMGGVMVMFDGVAGSTPPMTGSITGPNPNPTDVLVTVNAGTASLESGQLTSWPGVLSGFCQVQVRIPASTQSALSALPLTVTVGGVPAAPLVRFDKVYQSGGIVWVN